MLLYVDDAALILETQNDLEKATNKIYDTWETIGLTMHIG